MVSQWVTQDRRIIDRIDGQCEAVIGRAGTVARIERDRQSSVEVRRRHARQIVSIESQPVGQRGPAYEGRSNEQGIPIRINKQPAGNRKIDRSVFIDRYVLQDAGQTWCVGNARDVQAHAAVRLAAIAISNCIVEAPSPEEIGRRIEYDVSCKIDPDSSAGSIAYPGKG